MPFIGVRISWLMLARNSDFERLAAWAAASACFRAVTSFEMQITESTWPDTPRIGLTVVIRCRVPAGRGMATSMVCTEPCSKARRMTAKRWSPPSPGKMSQIVLPTICGTDRPSVWPKVRFTYW